MKSFARCRGRNRIQVSRSIESMAWRITSNWSSAAKKLDLMKLEIQTKRTYRTGNSARSDREPWRDLSYFSASCTIHATPSHPRDDPNDKANVLAPAAESNRTEIAEIANPPTQTLHFHHPTNASLRLAERWKRRMRNISLEPSLATDSWWMKANLRDWSTIQLLRVQENYLWLCYDIISCCDHFKFASQHGDCIWCRKIKLLITCDRCWVGNTKKLLTISYIVSLIHNNDWVHNIWLT